ncbi:hypothetical protein Trydic_g17671 [Trypoxylus dichotomus]
MHYLLQKFITVRLDSQMTKEREETTAASYVRRITSISLNLHSGAFGTPTVSKLPELGLRLRDREVIVDCDARETFCTRYRWAPNASSSFFCLLIYVRKRRLGLAFSFGMGIESLTNTGSVIAIMLLKVKIAKRD